MNSNEFYIKELIDINEDNSFSLINDEKKNVATVVILEGKITMYFDNGNVQEYNQDFDKMLKDVDDMHLNFIKLNNAAHRWKNYNPNPKNRKIGDCTLRSYCAAFNISWEEAFDIASEIAKENSSMIQYVAPQVLVDHFGCVEDENYKKKKKEERVTVANFAMTHPYGVYILQIRSHQVCVRNGEYWDTWDCGDKIVTNIFKA